MGTRLAWRFVLALALAGALWPWLGDPYLTTLLPPVNELLWIDGLPVVVVLDQGQIILGLRSGAGAWRAVALAGGEALAPGAAAALALLLAIPGLAWRRRPGWCTGVVSFLWCAQVLTLYQDSRVAATAILGTASHGALEPALSGQALGMVSAWVTPAAVLLAAVWAIGPRLWEEA